MTFLDERITFEVQVGTRIADLPEKGVYTYQVVAEDYWSQEGYNVLFVGNFYYDKKFRQTLDVTDIIRNSVGSHSTLANVLHDPYSLSQEQYYGNAISEYWVILTMQKDGATITKESSHKLVAKVYRYPNRSPYMILNGSLQFIDYSSNTFKNSYYTLTQGWKYSTYSKGVWDQLALVPRYPCRSTESFGWAATFGYGNNVASIPIYLCDQTGDWDDDITLYTDEQYSERYNSTWVSSLGSLFEDYFYNIEEHGVPFTDIDLYYTNTFNNRILIATFEACYSRYYLQWRDRFGGIQCQPFRDNITYSEDFDTEEEARNFYKYVDSELVRFAFLLTDEALTSLAKKVPDLGNYRNDNGIIDYSKDINEQLYSLFAISDVEQEHIKAILNKRGHN